MYAQNPKYPLRRRFGSARGRSGGGVRALLCARARRGHIRPALSQEIISPRARALRPVCHSRACGGSAALYGAFSRRQTRIVRHFRLPSGGERTPPIRTSHTTAYCGKKRQIEPKASKIISRISSLFVDKRGFLQYGARFCRFTTKSWQICLSLRTCFIRPQYMVV